MLKILKMPWWAYVISLALGLLVLWGVGVWWYAQQLETPDYKLVAEVHNYQIREYEPILVIQTVAGATEERNLDEGFMVLANYIFGNNRSQESIAMTSPVLEEPRQKIAMTTPVFEAPKGEPVAMTTPVFDGSSNGERVVTFTVPQKWTTETLPVPNDDRVNIVEWPAKTKAVKRFMTLSTYSQSARQKAAEELLEALARDGISHQGDLTYAFYNPPWTPFFLRRNEVMVTLRE